MFESIVLNFNLKYSFEVSFIFNRENTLKVLLLNIIEVNENNTLFNKLTKLNN